MDAAKAVTAIFVQPDATAFQITGRNLVGHTIGFQVTLGLSSADTCAWNFGDGATAPCEPDAIVAGTASPLAISVRGSHAYAQQGNYTVTVTASNAASAAAATTQVRILLPFFLPWVAR